MAGVAGRSGRKPGPSGAFEETITRRRIPVTPSEQERVKAKVVTRLRDHEKFDLVSFVRAAFTVDEISGIQVERILINSEHMKVGVMTRAVLDEHDLETWCLTTYRGPGKFCFKPVIEGVWVGPMKTLRLGTVDSSPDLDDQVDVDGSLAKVMNRESRIATLRQLKSLNEPLHGPAQGDDMKLGEVVEILKLVGVARDQQSGTGGPSELMLLREELRSVKEAMAAKPGLLTNLEPFIPLLTPMMGGVSKSLIGQVVRALLPQPAPTPAQVIEPSPTLMESLRSILEHPQIAAMIQPFLALAMQKMQQTQAIATSAPMATSPTFTPPGGSKMATFQTDDADLKEAISYIVLAIGERRFPDAYAMFQSFPEDLGSPFIGAIMPSVDSFPFVLKLQTLNEQLRPMRDNVLDFVKHVQTQIGAMLAAQEQMEREEAKSRTPRKVPPATA